MSDAPVISTRTDKRSPTERVLADGIICTREAVGCAGAAPPPPLGPGALAPHPPAGLVAFSSVPSHGGRGKLLETTPPTGVPWFEASGAGGDASAGGAEGGSV